MGFPMVFELMKLAPRGTAVIRSCSRLLASVLVLVCFFLPCSFVIALARKEGRGGIYLRVVISELSMCPFT